VAPELDSVRSTGGFPACVQGGPGTPTEREAIVTARAGSSPRAGEAAGEALVSIRGLTKRFPTATRGAEVHAIEHIDLDLRRGEFVAVVGPSGCGKSTMLSIVAGLMPPSTGEVLIDGSPVVRPVRSLGIAFQKDMLLEWRTILDNVMLQIEVRKMDKAKYRERALELLTGVGLGDFVHRYPKELSGGMRQRAALCRAFVHEPDLLLMDEPFAALDLLTRDQMALDFQRQALEESKTILFITHSIPEAVFLADRIAVFTPRPGKIADIFAIDLPRPRRLADRETQAFATYEGRVRRVLESYGILKEAD
jgi:NitT/TauT family transport system ATP-binding protein